LAGCERSRAAPTPATQPAIRISTDTIEFAAGAPQLAYLALAAAEPRRVGITALTGRLAWDDDATARVDTPVTGRVAEILVEQNQTVAAGQALARVRSPGFGQAQADVQRAATDLELAERAVARGRSLLEHQAIARKEVEAAEAELARARVEHERARVALAQFGGSPDVPVGAAFELRAPIAGVVVERTIQPGLEVRADQIGERPLFVVSDPTRLWLHLDVAEADVDGLVPGLEVVVRSRAMPERSHRGRITAIGAALDPATRTVKVRCSIDNHELLLRAEMYVAADVRAQANGGVEVPTQALFVRARRHYAFVERSPSHFERREVQVAREGSGRSVVSTGLAVGERVVTEGTLLLEAMLAGANP
jgi:cobalt-zinc-cadmium efflux system membrane fusion protein